MIFLKAYIVISLLISLFLCINMIRKSDGEYMNLNSFLIIFPIYLIVVAVLWPFTLAVKVEQ